MVWEGEPGKENAMFNLIARARFEQQLKWGALGLGILSTVAIIRDWYPWTMFIGLPFCLIWAYCA